MRVVGGISKGRRLISFKGLSIRPTSDKVREAVFNILPSDFPINKRVLDLFAGTGAMGVEALSRGAREAVFVDKNPGAVSVIKKNLELCGLKEKAGILKTKVSSAVNRLSQKGESFDLVFIDPPYEAGLTEDTLKVIDEKGLVSQDGFVVAETSRRLPITDIELKRLAPLDERRYGDTLVYFFTAK